MKGGPNATATGVDVPRFPLNGFVAQIGSRGEGSFADFEQRVRYGQVIDEVSAGQRVTYYRRQGMQLGISHSLSLDGLKYVLIDDRPQPWPAFVVNGQATWTVPTR
ncbi:MAG: hypothetical protein ACKV22_38230 [Bryobacteraceae bacterium]